MTSYITRLEEEMNKHRHSPTIELVPETRSGDVGVMGRCKCGLFMIARVAQSDPSRRDEFDSLSLAEREKRSHP